MQPVSYWVDKAATAHGTSTNWPAFLAEADSPNAYHKYFLRYPWWGYDGLWRATGDTTWLGYALTLGERAIASAVNVAGGYKGWYENGIEVVLREFCGFAGLSSVLRHMHEAGLDVNPAWSSRYDTLLAWMEENIWEKWYTRSLNNIYRSRMHMTAHAAVLGMNLGEISTRGAAQIAQYQTVAHNILTGTIPLGTPPNGVIADYGGGSYLIEEMETHPENANAWSWCAIWNTSTPPSDNIHSMHVVAALIEAHELGTYGITDAHIDKLVQTQLTNWNGSTVAPSWCEYNDGSGAVDGTIINSWHQFDWIKVARRSQALLEIYEGPPKYKNWEIGYYGGGAYAAYVLLNATPVALPNETVSVISGPDDGIAPGSTDISNTTASYGLVWPNASASNANYTCTGLRFALNAAQGETITNAYLSLHVGGVLDDANMTIYAHKVADAPDLATQPAIISQAARPRTTASVSWVATDLTGNGTTPGYVNSPDISAILNEIVSQTTWEPGNHIMLLLIATVADTGLARFAFGSYDGNDPLPQLIWTTEGAPVVVTPGTIPLGALTMYAGAFWNDDHVAAAGAVVGQSVMDVSVLEIPVYPSAQLPVTAQVMTVTMVDALDNMVSIVETDLDEG